MLIAVLKIDCSCLGFEKIDGVEYFWQAIIDTQLHYYINQIAKYYL